MTPWRKYKVHSYHAAERGIEFLLTFNEWMKIWDDSGHWHERGTYKGGYVMARFGDKGPYAIGNVKIIKHEENGSERVFKFNEEQKAYLSSIAEGRVISQETREKIRIKALGRKQSVETKNKKRASMLGKNKGKIMSDETRKKMRLSHLGKKLSAEHRMSILVAKGYV